MSIVGWVEAREIVRSLAPHIRLSRQSLLVRTFFAIARGPHALARKTAFRQQTARTFRFVLSKKLMTARDPRCFL
jgi:hypothetical protein